MLDETFVQSIAELAQDAQKKPQDCLLDIDGLTYYVHGDQLGKPILPPLPDPLNVGTLHALVDYLCANIDCLDLPCIAVHVVDYARVELISALDSPGARRRRYVAVTTGKWEFTPEQYYPLEQFLIKLPACFVLDDTLGQLCQALRGVTDKSTVKFSDDGFSMAVSAQAGLEIAQVEIRNPLYLAPMRTFPEINPPEMPWVFRMKKQEGAPPVCALFPADGGRWAAHTAGLIQDWLAERLEIAILA